MEIEFPSDYFRDYMKVIEDTEPPRLFHLWSAVSIVAASLGRKTHISLGIAGTIYPNHYVLLVGPPASKKSTAMKIARKMLKRSTNVRFAPTDTGGQRQGLLRALARGSEKDENAEALSALEASLNDPFMKDIHGDTTNNGDEDGDEDEDDNDKDSIVIQRSPLSHCNRHTLAAFWSEFTGAIGQANHSMMDFLVQTYDGDDYHYETKQGEMIVRDTLMGILACTSTTSIALALPPTADGHGFLSRFILVYGDRPYKRVVWPQEPNLALIRKLYENLSNINQNLYGQMTITQEGRKVAESLYDIQLEISDPRFTHYKSRRFTHLLKLALVLAASRMELIITATDIQTAHTILVATEKEMPEALGQFGLSPIAKLKQEIVEYLRGVTGPVAAGTLQAVFHRDARPQDIVDAINDLRTAGVIMQTKVADGTVYLTAKRAKRLKVREEDSQLAQFLIEQKGTQNEDV